MAAFAEPPCPLTPELRSDIAYRRAHGHPWDAIGVTMHYAPDALRRATENDPEFDAVQDRAWAEATWEGQADGMRRLRALANGCDDAQALKAAEVLVKFAAEQRRNDTRLAVEKLRAETRLAVEAARLERRAVGEAEVPWVMPPQPAPETEEEREKRFAREHAERAAVPRAEVYLWGGKHRLGMSHGPDETDARVRVKVDYSCGVGGRSEIYWVVPDPPPLLAAMPGEPDAVAAAAAWAAP